MSKAEILAQLPKLSSAERGEILAQLWQLEEAAGPSEAEKALLNEAQAAFDASPEAGASWAEVEARVSRRA